MIRLLYRLWYFLITALKGLRNTALFSIITLLTIAVSIFLVALFVQIYLSLSEIAGRMGKQIHIVAYLKMDITPAQVDAIRTHIRTWSEVESVHFVSIEEARERVQSLLPVEVLAGIPPEELPLEPSFEVNLHSRARRIQDIEAVSQKLERLEDVEGVQDIEYGERYIRLAFAVLDSLRYMGLLICIIITTAALFFVLSNIKLSIYMRRDEIEISRLVGSTNRFITIPFYLEGIIQGTCGAGIAVGMLSMLAHKVEHFMQDINSIRMTMDLTPYPVMLGCLLAGLGVGIIGGMVSVGRYLKI